MLPRKGKINAMAIWPFILVRRGYEISERTLRHEKIHHRQQLEMLLVFFYVWYFFEWLIKTLAMRKDAYRDISFEREAYANDNNPDYLKKRKFWGWFKYLRK